MSDSTGTPKQFKVPVGYVPRDSTATKKLQKTPNRGQKKRRDKSPSSTMPSTTTVVDDSVTHNTTTTTVTETVTVKKLTWLHPDMFALAVPPPSAQVVAPVDTSSGDGAAPVVPEMNPYMAVISKKIKNYQKKMVTLTLLIVNRV